MPIVRIDGSLISGWDSFHDAFTAAMGFPEFYGRNMNAWIDCMTSLDEPRDGLTSVHARDGEPLTLHVDNADVLPDEIFGALNECAAFVNWRRIETSQSPGLVLSYWRTEPTRP